MENQITGNINSSIEVKIIAIHSDYLVLESLADNEIFNWPIQNLPSQIKIGDKLSLELRPGCEEVVAGAIALTSISPKRIHNSLKKQNLHEQNPQEEDRRRLLEALVN